jgi:hypothetical protein
VSATIEVFNDHFDERAFRSKMWAHKEKKPDCPHCQGIDWLNVPIVLKPQMGDIPSYRVRGNLDGPS